MDRSTPGPPPSSTSVTLCGRGQAPGSRSDYPWGNIFVKISDKNKSESLSRIQKEFKSEFPFIPYQYKFKDAEVAEQYDKEAKWKQIVTFGAVRLFNAAGRLNRRRVLLG